MPTTSSVGKAARKVLTPKKAALPTLDRVLRISRIFSSRRDFFFALGVGLLTNFLYDIFKLLFEWLVRLVL